jgi:hypothetical protein
MTLTTKELLLIQDNIKMTQNCINFMQGCTDISSDTQIKNLCQQMAKDHQNDLQTLMKHVNSANMQ